MSTTDGDDKGLSDAIVRQGPVRRFRELYLADLSRVEPVSDVQILAAINRAELHGEGNHAARADIAAHLGFVHNSWTTQRLRPQIDALRFAGHICEIRRLGLDFLALTDDGRRALEKAQDKAAVILPESPQHRKWRHSRTMASDQIGGFRVASHSPGEFVVGWLRLRGMLCGDHLLGVRRGWWSGRGVAKLAA